MNRVMRIRYLNLAEMLLMTKPKATKRRQVAVSAAVLTKSKQRIH